MRDAQSSWQRLPALDTAEAHELEARFREACRRVSDQGKPHGSAPARQAQRVATPEAMVV